MAHMYSVCADNEVARELLAGAELNLACFGIEIDKTASQEKLRRLSFAMLGCCQIFEGRVEVGSVDEIPVLLGLRLAMPNAE